MKFICTQENIVRGTSKVSAIAGRNNQLPILQHVLLQVRDGVLHLTTTDLEVGAHSMVGGKAEGIGSCTVPARSFLEYVQQLPGKKPISLEVKDGSLICSTTGFRARFPVANPDDFPLLPDGDESGAREFSAKDFCAALSSVIFAASREDMRPEIRSVYISMGDGQLRVAATDSFRLAESITAIEGTGESTIILPLASAQEVVRLFSSQETISVSVQESHVLFYGDDIELSSRLVDGTYPNYQQIIPKTQKTTITVNKERILRALKTLTLFLPRDSRRVELLVSPKEEEIVARVAGGSVGQGRVKIPCTGTGGNVAMLMNIQYILDGLQHFSSDEISLGLSSPQDPVIFRPVGQEGYLYVVMPIQAS